MKDIKSGFYKWLGLQYWPFGRGWILIVILAVIMPSVFIVIENKGFHLEIDKPDFSASLVFFPLIILSCHNIMKLRNIFISAVWITLLMVVTMFLGSCFLPCTFGLISSHLEMSILFILTILPFLYLISLGAIYYQKKNLFKQEEEKMFREFGSQK